MTFAGALYSACEPMKTSYVTQNMRYVKFKLVILEIFSFR